LQAKLKRVDEQQILSVLNKELVPALGCTEPIAIALAAAIAVKYLPDEEVTDLKVYASNNVIKNALSVIIPGTGSSGINLAVALGSLSKNEHKGLEILNGLSETDIEKARFMIKDGLVSVNLADTSKKLYIEVIVKTSKSQSRVIIEDTHTQVSLIEVDGKIIRQGQPSGKIMEEEGPYSFLNVDTIWEFVQTVSTDKLDLIQQSIDLNKKAGIAGLQHNYGLQVGKTIHDNMTKGLLSDDLTNYAMALTAAGSDARMGGGLYTVMSNSGSGNQGIAATLPVVAVWEKLKLTEEQLLRATLLSQLITIYIKSKFGRLSALCGVTIASTGASCGIVYLLEGGRHSVQATIQNMVGNVAGMICDGAKAGCALKVSTCTNAAVQSALLAIRGISINATNGIIGENVEQTIENLCRLGNQGTVEADKIILDIMLNKDKEVCL
jgi:L-cysteine desulfidase